MTMTQTPRLKDKYLPLFLGLLLFLCYFSVQGQTYNPSVCCTVSNKAYGSAQGNSTEGRSWFYDLTNFIMRDYNGTTEVFSYLNLAKYRLGHFPIFVHTGGILQGNGVWLGGSTLVYWFKDSTGNANLVRWYTDSTGVSGGPFYAVANNLSEGNAGLIKGNLALDLVNNTSDAQKNAASVSLSNHTIDANNNTLSHIPNSALTNNTIGLTINSAAGSDISVTTTPAALGSGLVFNVPSANGSSRGALTSTDWNTFNNKQSTLTLTIAGTSGPATFISNVLNIPQYTAGAGCLNCNADSLKKLPVDTTLNRNGYALTFDSTNHKWVLAPNGAGSGITSLFGDATAAGSGSVPITLATVNGNVGTFGNASSVYQGTVNAKGLTTAATSVAIQIAESQVTNLTTDLGLKLSSALVAGDIFVGNGSNIATAVPPTGDWTITNAGVNVIGANKVSYSKIQAAAGQGLMGATGAGNFGLITLGTNLSMIGPVLNAAGSSGPPNYSANYDTSGILSFGPYSYYVKCDTTGVIDATVAIQRAIDTTVAHGGGDIYLPNGRIKISGALDTIHGNYQIYIPYTNPFTGSPVSIRVHGAPINSLPGGGYQGGTITFQPNTGTVIYSTISGTVTPGGKYPSVFGAYNPSGNFNFTDITMDNIYVQLYTNHATVAPSLSAFDFHNLGGMIHLIKLRVSTDTSNQVSPNPISNETVGIAVGNFLDGGPNIIEGCIVTGVKYAYIPGEHTEMNANQAFANIYNLVLPKGAGEVIVTDFLSEASQWDILSPTTTLLGVYTPGLSFARVNLAIENDTTGPGWYNRVGNLKDSLDDLRGDIHYIANDSHGAITHDLVRQGADFIGLVDMNGNVYKTQIYNNSLGGISSGLKITGTDPNQYAFSTWNNDVGSAQILLGGSTTALGPQYANTFLFDNTITGAGFLFGSVGFPKILSMPGNSGNVALQTANAKLGIGIDVPTAALHVSGSTAFVQSLIQNSNGGSGEITLTDMQNSAGNNFEFGKLGPNYSPSGLFVPNAGYIFSNGGAPLFLASASQPIDFSVDNGGTSAVRVSSNKSLLVGTTTDVPTSLFTLFSTTKGFLPPRMTLAQATAISSPATSLHFVLTDSTGKLGLWNGSKIVTYATTDQLGSASFVYGHTIFTPTTGGTVNLINRQYNIINPAGALLALTVNLPSSPANNDVVYIKFTQTISTVTYANGTVVDGVTAPTAGGLTVLTFDAGTTSWY